MSRNALSSAVLASLLCTSAAFASARIRHTSAHPSLHRGSARSGHTAHATVRHEAVRVMDPERATAIQSALIEKGYMTGEPTGSWDAASVTAMQRLQGENGWQTRITPDSRALIKLGLGPQQAAVTTLQ